MAGTLVRDVLTRWIALTASTLFGGVLCDGIAWATSAWGHTEQDSFYTYFGLWQICNGTRELSGAERREINRSPPTCVFPTQVDFDWIPKALVMEIMAGFCTVAIFVCLLLLLICLKYDWLRSRHVLVVLVPLALLSGLFNFIGLLIVCTNMRDLKTTAGYSVAFDALASVFFAFATVFGVMDMQGCCLKKRPANNNNKGLTRPI